MVAAALIAGPAAWGLLALLERTLRHPARTFRIIALITLALSLVGPLGSGADTSSRLVLLAMHLTIGAALITGLPYRRNRTALAGLPTTYQRGPRSRARCPGRGVSGRWLDR